MASELDCLELLGKLKEIIPTALFKTDRQFCLADWVSDFVPLFKTEHREKLLLRAEPAEFLTLLDEVTATAVV